jgi:hypothetical protein
MRPSLKQGLKQMATVKELKATTRPAGGKGRTGEASRRERSRVIYGSNQPP